MTEIFDHVVIGAGIIGSCTAWQLAKRGKNVLLLEQFHLPTVRGSSHGQSRLLRTSYCERYYASLMPDACALWKEIEQESGTTIFKNTKVVFLTSDDEKFREAKKNMEDFAPEHLEIGNALDYYNPEFLRFPSNYKAILDGTGGVLFAQKALTTIQNLFKKYGGKIRDGEPVTSIKNDGDDVIITTKNSKVCAKSLVVCAGAWTSRLFSNEINQLLAKYLQPLAVKVYYWKVLKNPGSELPCFLDEDSSHPSDIYGIFSSDEYPGLVKICVHGGVPCDPNERDKVQFRDIENELIKYIKERLPMLDPVPAIIETCMYTKTPDDIFIVDRVPTYRNVYIGSGFSGTGFKKSTAVGKLLCELVLGLPSSHDLKTFSLSRFN